MKRRPDLKWPSHWSYSIPEQIAAGYAWAEVLELGDDAFHPQREHHLYHALNAGLKRRGLRLSMFLRVIEAKCPRTQRI